MNLQVLRYLDSVQTHLHLDAATEYRVLRELGDHFSEQVGELVESGYSEEEAARQSIEQFGPPRGIARKMYQALSRGTWVEALLAAEPHAVAALVFALHVWRRPAFAALGFIPVVVVTLLGWRRGKPNWLYSWIGYALLPLAVASYMMRDTLLGAVGAVFGRATFPPAHLVATLLLLVGAGVWVVSRTTIRVARRDWTLATMMFAPLPLFCSWLVHLDGAGGLDAANTLTVQRWDAFVAGVLMVFAISSAAAIRARRRAVKTGMLVSLGVASVVVASLALWGDTQVIDLLRVAVLTSLVLLSPALFRRGFRRRPLSR